MNGLPPAALALAGVILLCVGSAAARSGHPVRSTLSAAACGIGALGAVNLLAPVTGVALALNYATAFVTVVLGAPGVITLLLLQLLMR